MEYTKHKHNVIICSFTSFKVNIKFLSQEAFSYIFIDEAHHIKNDQANFYKFLAQLSVKRKLLLTGTPLANDITELRSFLNYLMPDIFTSKEAFEEYFCALDTRLVLPKDQRKQLKIAKSLAMSAQDTVKKIHELMAPFVLRRLKQDTDLNLPDKKEIIVYCPLSSVQRTIQESSGLQFKSKKHQNWKVDTCP